MTRCRPTFVTCVLFALLSLAISDSQAVNAYAVPGDNDGPSTSASEPRVSGSKYLRYVTDENGGATLQASVVRFENAEGKTVDLVAAVHVGERSFYRALDASFADYDAVLYELVAPKEMLSPTTQGSTLRKLGPPTQPSTQAAKRGASLAWVGGLQRFLKDTLKLTFQLEQIDYKRSNFVHADLDAETFAELQSNRGESMFTLMLNSMMREVGKSQTGGAAAQQPNLFELLAALRSPDKARELKLILGRQFGEIDSQFDANSVLVGERNKAALRVLRDELASGQQSHFAIFYGAAHLSLMEQSLTQDMGFHQVGPPFWRVAWDMTATAPPTTKPAPKPAARNKTP